MKDDLFQDVNIESLLRDINADLEDCFKNAGFTDEEFEQLLNNDELKKDIDKALAEMDKDLESFFEDSRDQEIDIKGLLDDPHPPYKRF